VKNLSLSLHNKCMIKIGKNNTSAPKQKTVLFRSVTQWRRRDGFTLIEFLLYIGLVGIILTVAGAICLNIIFGKAKLMAIEEVSQNARFVMEDIAKKVRNAEAINSPSQGTSATTLSLQMADSAKNPTIFDISGNSVRIQEGIGPIVSLSSSEVIVSNVQFTNISYTDTPGTVRIQMTIKLVNPGNRQEYNFEKTFYTTANIRENL